MNYLQYAIQTFTTAERTVPHTSDVPGGGGASVGDRLGVHDRNPLLVEQASGISKQQAMRTKQQSAARVLMTRVIPVVKEG